MILSFAKLLIEEGIANNKEDIKKVFVYALPVADMFDIKEIKNMSITTDGKKIFIKELDNFNDDFKDIKAIEAYTFYGAFNAMIKFNDNVVETANELCKGLCEVAAEHNDGKITAKLANEYIAYYKVYSKFRNTKNKLEMFKKIKQAIILPPIYIHEIYHRIIRMRNIEAIVAIANYEFIEMHKTKEEGDFFVRIISAIYGGVLNPIIMYSNYYVKGNPIFPKSKDLYPFMDKKIVDDLVEYKMA